MGRRCSAEEAGQSMHQIIQDRGSGTLRVAEVPIPIAEAGHVVVANVASVLSAGTERMVRELARGSLLKKARARPDQVRRVLQKVRQEGILPTVRQVRGLLREPMPLGYSSSGVVLACGSGVEGLRPGDRVASNGPHAGAVSVPEHLCALVPDAVSHDHAAFAVIGTIALQGVRLSRLSLGETAYVIGLGLVGQITVALLKASGCRVLGVDLDPSRCELALRMGADEASVELDDDAVQARTAGLGADAVLVTAATSSSGPIEAAGRAVRKKGRVVVVGAVGLEVPRDVYYLKEAEIVVSCSYGPGRYDPGYEDRGRDYPPAYVRWTEQRNLQAVLDLMAGGGLDVGPLISHRFPVERAAEAYELIEHDADGYLGVLLEYPEIGDADTQRRDSTVTLRPAVDGGIGLGFVGAGSFAGAVLLPSLDEAGVEVRRRVICSARGLSAIDKGERFGFERATSDEQEVLTDEFVDAVFLATRHDLHAAQVMRALSAGKHVFVEKPLALQASEILQIDDMLRALREEEGAPVLMVGFNRRFASASRRVREFFGDVSAPITVSIRFNAGAIAEDHWAQDEEVGGGRIVGEACHGIDLATYLVGSAPVRVFCEGVGGRDAPSITQDQCFITLRHANGAVSSIGYLAGGDRSLSKERVEVIGGGRAAVIDDFRGVTLVKNGKTRERRLKAQDKGHTAELRDFLQAVCGRAEAPIPWAELRAVSLAAIYALRSLREGMPLEVSAGR